MATIKGIKAGTTTITASYGGKTSSASLTVSQIAPSLTFTAYTSTLTYSGNKQGIGTVSYTGDGTAYYLVQTSSSVPDSGASGWTTISNGGVVQSSAATAGTYYVFLKSTAGTNYTAVSPKSAGNKAIDRTSGSVSLSATSGTITYSSTTTTFTVTRSGDGAISVSTSNSSIATASVSGTTVTVTRAGYGSATITVNVAQSTNYNATSTTFSVTCNRASQPGTMVTNNPVYSSGSNLVKVGTTYKETPSIYYAVGTQLTSSNYSSSGSTTVPTTSGRVCGTTYTVYWYSTQTTNYLASSGSVSVTLSKASITPTVTMSGYTYGGTKSTPSISGNTGSGTVTYYYNTTNSNSGGTAWSNVSGSSSLNAGTYYMYATVGSTTNYNGATSAAVSFTISKASITPTVTMSGYTYGGTKSTPSISGNTGSGTVTYYYNTTNSNSGGTAWSNVTSSTSLNAGTYYMYATVASTTNYSSATSAAVSFTISKATGSGSVTMSGWTYGGTVTNPTPTSSTNGTSNVSYTWYNSSKTQLSSKPTSTSTAGTYYVKATFAATTNYNAYTTDYVSFTISKASCPSITFSNDTVTASCLPNQSERTTTAFDASTGGNGATPSYSLIKAVKSGSTTALTGWSVNSSNRTIGVPANTKADTYVITVRSTYAETTNYLSGTADSTITLTLSKGTQTLTLDKSTLSLTYPGTGDITASGYVGTLSVVSGTTSVATVGTLSSGKTTVSSVAAGTSTVTFTAAANDYVNSATASCTVTVTRRTGAVPTFNNSSVTASCLPNQSERTTTAFTAGSANHSGSLSYSLVSAKNSSGTSLTGWSVNSLNRTIGVPANTKAGTYTIVVRCTEAQTNQDTESTKDATITLTLSKGNQTLTLDKSTLSLTYPGTGTITASGYVGTLSVVSGTTSTATVSLSGAVTTVSSVAAGTSTVTVTAAENDYVNSVSKTCAVTVSRGTGAAPTFGTSSVSATLVQAGSAVTTNAFTAGTANHSGSLSYSFVSAHKKDSSTSLTWTVNSSSRTIGVPANTPYGTYYVTVRCTEGQTNQYNSSSTDAEITVTLNRGTQELTLNKSTLSLTIPTTGTITASGYAGTLSVSSSATNIATCTNAATSTITPISTGNSSSNTGTGSATITFTAAATDYVNSATASCTVTVNHRTGAAPTFGTSSVSAELVQAGSAVTTNAFTAGTANHSGSLSYSFVSAHKKDSSTSLTWTVNSSSRTIGVPANTPYGTYYVTVRCTEGTTATDTSSYTDAEITVTLNRGTQPLTLDKTTLSLNYNGTTGTITATGYAGTLSVVSGTTGVATVSALSSGTTTVTPVASGTSIVTFTAAATNYVNSATASCTVTVNSISAIISAISGDSVEYEQGTAKPSVTYTGGTLYYATCSTENGTYSSWTTTQPTRSTVGTTYVKCYVKGDSNHTDSSISSVVSITIYKADDARATVTINSSTLTYSGSAQNIATVEQHGCTAYLGFGSSDKVAPTSWFGANTTATATNAGTYYVWYKFTPDENHSNSNSGTYVGSKEIVKAQPSGSVSCNNVTYGSTVTATVSGNSGSGTITWGITNGTGKATISSSGVVTPTQAGTVVVTASVAATANYKAYTATSKEITISKATGTISYSPDAKSVTFSTSSQTVSCTAASGVKESATITYTLNSVVNSGSTTQTGYSLSGTTLTIPASATAGTYTVSITANAAATTNYNSVSSDTKTFTLTINKHAQTLTISPASATIYSNTSGSSAYSSFTITPSNNQGTVTYESSDTSKATVTSAGVVTYVGAGNCTITVTAAGNTNYNSGSQTCAVTCIVDTKKTFGNLNGTIVITQSKNFEAKGLTLTTSNFGTYFTYTQPCSQTVTWESGAQTSGTISYSVSESNATISSLGTTVTSAVTSREINFTVTATGEGSKTSSTSVTSGNQEINALERIELTLASTVAYLSSVTPVTTAYYTSESHQEVSASYTANPTGYVEIS